MSMMLLSLLLVSPILGYATYLLLQEFNDPLEAFHDVYRTQLTSTSDQSAFVNSGEVEMTPRATKLSFSSDNASLAMVCGILFFVIAFANSPRFALVAGVFIAVAIFKWRPKFQLRANESRRRAIEGEFPAFAEIYTILVVAGESPSLALIRVAERFEGTFGELLRVSSLELTNGGGLQTALEKMSAMSASKMIRRFVDALIIAIERGTPLADVLHRQVEDARKRQHTEITKLAGKAEISLMIPVVFLILPISVLFALWPSYLALGQNML